MTYRENHHPLPVCLLIFGASYQFERHFFLFLFSSLLEGVERCCRGTVGKLIFKCAHIYICKCFNLALFPLGKKKHKCRHKSKGKNELQDIPLSCQLWCAWIGCSQSKKKVLLEGFQTNRPEIVLYLVCHSAFFVYLLPYMPVAVFAAARSAFVLVLNLELEIMVASYFRSLKGGRAVGVIFL